MDRPVPLRGERLGRGDRAAEADQRATRGPAAATSGATWSA